MKIQTNDGFKYSAIHGKILDQWMYNEEFTELCMNKILRETAIMNIVNLQSVVGSLPVPVSNHLEAQAESLIWFFKIQEAEIKIWKETYKGLLRGNDK